MIWHILGTLAAICTTVGFIPQIIRGIKTKRLNNVIPLCGWRQFMAGLWDSFEEFNYCTCKWVYFVIRSYNFFITDYI